MLQRTGIMRWKNAPEDGRHLPALLGVYMREDREGGPRFRREWSRDMRLIDSVCAIAEGWPTKEAKIAADIGGASSSLCAATLMAGWQGHFSNGALNRVPRLVRLPRSTVAAMQWCFPLWRQHAGRRDASGVLNANRGETTGRPNTASNRMESSLRNRGIEPLKYV